MKVFLVFVGFLLALDAFGLASAASFVDNGDQTVSDLQSGLTWDQRETTAMTWTAALSYCENLSFAGQPDWRLPNRNELESLVDDTKTSSPTINTTYFPSAVSNFYWSSTTYALVSANAWSVDFGVGNVGNYSKTVNYYVRCVR